MPTVKANGIDLYYETHGAGEPLLLVMGLGANATNWADQVPAFSREYQVIAFDNRGAGRSEKPQDAYSIHQMAEDAAELLDQLGVHSAHVFGMSMGGMIAQELALRHAARVRTLVLGGTMAGGPGSAMPSPAAIQSLASLASMGMEQAIEAGLRFFYSEAYIAANRDRLVQRALSTMHLMPPPHAFQKQVMAVLGFNAHGRLKDIRFPTLVVGATDDQIVPYPNQLRLAEQIPGARLVTFEGAGHGFLTERADEVNEAVLDFLRPHRTHFVPAK